MKAQNAPAINSPLISTKLQGSYLHHSPFTPKTPGHVQPIDGTRTWFAPCQVYSAAVDLRLGARLWEKLRETMELLRWYALVNIQKAIENGHRNSGFIHCVKMVIVHS